MTTKTSNRCVSCGDGGPGFQASKHANKCLSCVKKEEEKNDPRKNIPQGTPWYAHDNMKACRRAANAFVVKIPSVRIDRDTLNCIEVTCVPLVRFFNGEIIESEPIVANCIWTSNFLYACKSDYVAALEYIAKHIAIEERYKQGILEE